MKKLAIVLLLFLVACGSSITRSDYEYVYTVSYMNCQGAPLGIWKSKEIPDVYGGFVRFREESTGLSVRVSGNVIVTQSIEKK